jgi:predicted transposase/invertase (TIGR01784 family)
MRSARRRARAIARSFVTALSSAPRPEHGWGSDPASGLALFYPIDAIKWEFLDHPNTLNVLGLFGESLLYFYRNRDYYSDWQAVVIYPSRSMEQTDAHPYRALLNSDQVHRVYLNELGKIEALPLGVAAMVLTIVGAAEAPQKARMLISRANQAVASLSARQGIIDMISTIVIYKFTNLSREEIDAMLGTKLKETRVYREAREEERLATETRIALNLLRENIPLEMIARTIGLTIDQIQQLQAQVEPK